MSADRTLEELQHRFPDEWRIVRAQLLALEKDGRLALQRLLVDSARSPSDARDRALAMPQRVTQLAQRRMLEQSLQSFNDRRESGVKTGTIRFGRWNAALLQRVLFAQGLVRKPVRLPLFRIAWRLAPQRRRLMPLVRRRGIYCFYSAALIRRLAQLTGPRAAIELGAGDGTLTRFLQEAGVDVTATDDHSWATVIDYPSWVKRLDARAALRKYAPQVVLCSWPPPGNTFERAVFETRSVQTYIVITSADPREAGNWSTYDEQTDFQRVEVPQLARLVLPPRRNDVLIFQRRSR